MEPPTKFLIYLDHQKENSFFKNFIAGGTAGAIASLVTAPIERIKIVLQVQDLNQTKCSGIINCAQHIYKTQGVISFWRGNLANTLRIFPTASFNFAFKEKFKKYFLYNVDKETEYWRFFVGNVMSGGLAGLSCLTIVYPLDFARTRLAADLEKDGKQKFSGILDCLKKVYRTNGVFGVYRGFAVSASGIIVYRSAYFGLYDSVCDMLIKDEGISFFKKFLIAQSVVLVAGLIAYPFDTVRKQMMMQAGLPKNQIIYKNTLNCWYSIAQNRGFKGFYNGAVSNLFVGTGSALILVFYDQIKKYM